MSTYNRGINQFRFNKNFWRFVKMKNRADNVIVIAVAAVAATDRAFSALFR